MPILSGINSVAWPPRRADRDHRVCGPAVGRHAEARIFPPFLEPTPYKTSRFSRILVKGGSQNGPNDV